jgi:uncharacterized membrane protein HdeD (DUF308 family)
MFRFMNPDDAKMNVSPLSERWWVVVIRGVAAILFGILALVWPGISLLFLVILWGAYALTDGVFNLVMAVRRARAGRRWGWLVFEGIVSILAGALTFAWPGITAWLLSLMIAAWAVVTGIAEIASAIRLRQYIRGEWLLALSGLLSIVFGVLLAMFPRAGALALAWTIGIYAIVFGALLIGLGLRLHHFHRGGPRSIPTDHAATPAL